MMTPQSIIDGTREIFGEAWEDATNSDSIERGMPTMIDEARLALLGIKSSIVKVPEFARKLSGTIIDSTVNQTDRLSKAIVNRDHLN